MILRVLFAFEPRPAGPGQRLAGTTPEARIGAGVPTSREAAVYLAYSTFFGVMYFLPSFSETTPVTLPSFLSPPQTASW